MKCALKCSVPALLLMSMACGPEAPPPEFSGTLNEELVPAERPSVYETMRPVADKDLDREALGVSTRARVFSGNWRIAPGIARDVYFVEDGQARLLATDADSDGELTAGERFAFEPLSDGNGQFMSEAAVPIAATHTRYDTYPILVRLPAARFQTNEDLRFLWRSVRASVMGTVALGDRELQVRYDGFHPGSGKLDPTSTGVGVDSNGDGKIPADPRSPEWAYAQNENVVFRVGDRYLSTKSLDLEEGRVVLQSHDASDYRRIELSIGATIPDFDFVDFEGRRRNFSEFAGQPLLLDFWGAWCGPCIREIPHLKEAYQRFHPQGLEILGMDFDPSSRNPSPEQLAQGLERARGVIEQHGIEWPQARTESILELITERFRISAYPTMVLLDSEGRIVSAGAAGQLPLRGPGLIETLEGMFGAESAGGSAGR